MRICVLLLLISLSTFANSKNSDYEYCIVWGVAGGTDDQFTQNLVGRILAKKGIEIDDVCTTLKQTGYKHGQKYSRGNTQDSEATKSWFIYQDFRDKYMDKLVELIEQ
jgi:hypothetical protein